MEAICVYGLVFLLLVYMYIGMRLVWILLERIKIVTFSDRTRRAIVHTLLTILFLIFWPYICYKVQQYGKEYEFKI